MKNTHTNALDDQRTRQLTMALDRIVGVVNSLLLATDGSCACRNGDLCAHHAAIYNHLLTAGREIRQAQKAIQRGGQ